MWTCPPLFQIVCILYSSCEPSELPQWLCYGDSAINVVVAAAAVVVVVIIIIIIWKSRYPCNEKS